MPPRACIARRSTRRCRGSPARARPTKIAGSIASRCLLPARCGGAFDGAAMSGVIAFRDGWIGQLYVLPGAQGRGIGGALLEIARPGPAAALDVSVQRPRAASTRRAVLSRMRRPTSSATRRGSPACAIAGRAGRRVSDIDRNS
ncbi:GNAT family N-acetyltransferase [Bradyrhizobium elkanii]